MFDQDTTEATEVQFKVAKIVARRVAEFIKDHGYELSDDKGVQIVVARDHFVVVADTDGYWAPSFADGYWELFYEVADDDRLHFYVEAATDRAVQIVWAG